MSLDPAAVFEDLADAVLQIEGTRIVRQNAAARELLGGPPDGAELARQLLPESADRFRTWAHRVEAGEPHPRQVRLHLARRRAPVDVHGVAMEGGWVLVLRPVRSAAQVDTLVARLAEIASRVRGTGGPLDLLRRTRDVFDELGWSVALAEVDARGTPTRVDAGSHRRCTGCRPGGAAHPMNSP